MGHLLELARTNTGPANESLRSGFPKRRLLLTNLFILSISVDNKNEIRHFRPGNRKTQEYRLAISSHIQRLIASGELRPGQKLPSTQELAAKWGTHPATVQTALMPLAKQGLLSRRPGSRHLRASEFQAPDLRGHLPLPGQLDPRGLQLRTGGAYRSGRGVAGAKNPDGRLDRSPHDGRTSQSLGGFGASGRERGNPSPGQRALAGRTRSAGRTSSPSRPPTSPPQRSPGPSGRTCTSLPRLVCGRWPNRVVARWE